MVKIVLDELPKRATEREQIKHFIAEELMGICNSYLNGEYDIPKFAEDSCVSDFVALVGNDDVCFIDFQKVFQMICQKAEQEQFEIFFEDICEKIFLYYSIFFNNIKELNFLKDFNEILLKLDDKTDKTIKKYGIDSIDVLKNKYNICFSSGKKEGFEILFVLKESNKKEELNRKGFVLFVQDLLKLNDEIYDLCIKFQNDLCADIDRVYSDTIRQITSFDLSIINSIE